MRPVALAASRFGLVALRGIRVFVEPFTVV
jgi:hypothetical protein